MNNYLIAYTYNDLSINLSVKAGLKSLIDKNLLLKIANIYDFDTSTFSFIDSFENFIYQVKGDIPYIVRISHESTKSFDLIKGELNWIEFLSDFKIPIIQPIKSMNKNYIEKITATDGSTFFIVVFVKEKGDTIANQPKLMTETIITKWGSLVANLHNITKTYNPEVKLRNHWYENWEIQIFEKSFYEFPKLLEYSKNIIEKVKNLPKSPDTYGLIHFDINEMNLIVRNDEFVLIDFDDITYHYFIADFSSLLFQLAWRFHTNEKSRDEVVKEFLPTFLRGYRQSREISEYWFSKIPLFLELRWIQLFSGLIEEEKIEKSEWGQKLIKSWLNMFDQNRKWIELEFKLENFT